MLHRLPRGRTDDPGGPVPSRSRARSGGPQSMSSGVGWRPSDLGVRNPRIDVGSGHRRKKALGGLYRARPRRRKVGHWRMRVLAPPSVLDANPAALSSHWTSIAPTSDIVMATAGRPSSRFFSCWVQIRIRNSAEVDRGCVDSSPARRRTGADATPEHEPLKPMSMRTGRETRTPEGQAVPDMGIEPRGEDTTITPNA